MPDENSSDDKRLVEAVRGGDRAAFDTLYDRYAGRVYAFALRVTGGDRAEAEDLTQEAFVAAFRGLGGFRGGAGLLTWLFAIALRRWRDKRRSHPPTAIAVSADLLEPAAVGFEAGTVEALRLSDALARLPEALRHAFLLVTVQELTYGEAARALRCPATTVRWRVGEAHRRLRVLLADDDRVISTRGVDHESHNAAEPVL